MSPWAFRVQKGICTPYFYRNVRPEINTTLAEMLLPKSVLVIGRYSLSVSGNQQVIGSLCQFAVSNWSPLVAKTDEEQRPMLIWAITFQLLWKGDCILIIFIPTRCRSVLQSAESWRSRSEASSSWTRPLPRRPRPSRGKHWWRGTWRTLTSSPPSISPLSPRATLRTRLWPPWRRPSRRWRRPTTWERCRAPWCLIPDWPLF